MKKFILFEGGDGAGKSSCALEMTKMTGGIYYNTPPPLFNNIRPLIEESGDYNLRFYYYLTGVLYASKEIKKLLERTHVICDRYLYTTMAYHSALGVIMPANLEKLVIAPDYCFCLHAREEIIKKRIKERKTLGVFDNAFGLQQEVFRQFKNFGLELFDTSDLSAEQSVRQMLQKIQL